MPAKYNYADRPYPYVHEVAVSIQSSHEVCVLVDPNWVACLIQHGYARKVRLAKGT